MIENDSATAAQRFATVPISYAADPSSMEELADRVGELKAAKSDLDAYLRPGRMRTLSRPFNSQQKLAVTPLGGQKSHHRT